jgi:ribosomal protein S18 acetylase RimI-like enzyme
MNFEVDGWLSRAFSMPVWRVPVPSGGIAAEMAADLSGHAASQSTALYYAKFPTGQIETARQLIGAGFYPVDVNLTFRFAGSPPAPGVSHGLVVEPAQAEHEPAISAIAGGCFQYSRFHLDPLIGNELANKVKREWVRSYFRKERGVALWVALDKSRPLGFLAVALRSTPATGQIAFIDLIGVDPQFQRRGVGHALVNHFVRQSASLSDTLEVGTQAANLPSLKLYERSGFQMVSSTYVMHCHIRNGRPGAKAA